MGGAGEAEAEILHAGCVALEGRGLLILGPSGAGKSALALWLMALGARLVADDRTRVTRLEGGLLAACPAAIGGRIEARGLGILAAAAAGEVPLALAVDLGRPEPDRLPPRREITILGCALPLALGAGNPHLAPGLVQWMRGGRAQ